MCVCVCVSYTYVYIQHVYIYIYICMYISAISYLQKVMYSANLHKSNIPKKVDAPKKHVPF